MPTRKIIKDDSVGENRPHAYLIECHGDFNGPTMHAFYDKVDSLKEAQDKIIAWEFRTHGVVIHSGEIEVYEQDESGLCKKVWSNGQNCTKLEYLEEIVRRYETGLLPCHTNGSCRYRISEEPEKACVAGLTIPDSKYNFLLENLTADSFGVSEAAKFPNGLNHNILRGYQSMHDYEVTNGNCHALNANFSSALEFFKLELEAEKCKLAKNQLI